MKEKYLTGKKEIFFLIINLIFFKSFANGPKSILRECGSSAFLSGAAAALICLAVAAVLGALYEKTDCRNIFELSKKYISPLFSSALQIIIILYLALSLSIALKETVNFASLAAFETAPFAFIALFFAVAAFFSVKRGMEAIVRAIEIIMPFSLAVTLIMLFSTAKEWDASNLFPLFGYGFGKTAVSAIKSTPYYLDFILIFLINPFFETRENLKKTVFSAVLFGTAINLLTLLTVNLILPYQTMPDIDFPVYQIMKTVYFGRFMQRIDAFYLLAFSLSAMSYISFGVFLMNYLLKGALGLSKNRPSSASFALIILFGAMLAEKGILNVSDTALFIFELLVFIIIFLMPLLPENVKKEA